MNQHAQGTIEYLVILAIVIVVALVVLVASGNMFGTSSGISSDVGKITAISGSISVGDAVVDSGGEGLLLLKNSSSESLTITKISLGGADTNFNKKLLFGDQSTFYLANLANNCSCSGFEGQTKICTAVIYYTTNASTSNATTSSRTLNVSVDCVGNASATQSSTTPTYESNSPVVGLTSPSDENVTVDGNVTFAFTATDDSTISSCELLMDGTGTGSTTAPSSGTGSIDYTIPSEGRYAWNVSCTDQYSNSGTGTALDINYENPYLIGSCLELQDMNLDLTGDYNLVANIDCNISPYNTGSGFNPVGDDSTSFSGSFDGNEYIISNLFINRSSEDYVGLFGQTGSTTVISNVGLVDQNITGANRTGALVGNLAAGSSIDSSYSTGFTTGTGEYVGGLVGLGAGVISNSYTTGTTTGTGDGTGGLVGINFSTIMNSYTTGTTIGLSDYTGGIVGNSFFGTIVNCHSSGTTTGTTGVGGILGLNSSGYLTNSYSTGTTIGTDQVGGLIGRSGGTTTNSFSVGTVISPSSAYGLIGSFVTSPVQTNLYWLDSNASDDATNCYSTGDGGCTKASAVSDFYPSSYNVYDLNVPYWDGNWSWSGDTYPTLSWES